MTEKQATVEILARIVGERWRRSVHDHGIDAESGFTENVFDLCMRLWSGHPVRGEALVEQHGGQISGGISSLQRIDLQLHSVEETRERGERVARSRLRFGAETAVTRVLLVEDNPEDARHVQRLLSVVAPSFDLTTVGRLSDGLVHLTTGDIDVVLLDLGLPDSDPTQTLDRVLPEARGIPIIILMGQNDDRMAARAVGSGAQDFLDKRHIDGPLLARSLRYAVERQRTQDALCESEERYALAVEGANDGLWDWNLRSNEVYYSPRWMSILGIAEKEVTDRPEAWMARVHPEDVKGLKQNIDRHLSGETDHFLSEHRIRCQDGGYRWMLSRGVARRDARGATRMGGSLTDIHARKVVEERLRRDALSDTLTGLPNWILFKDQLRAAIAKSRRQPDYEFAVLFLDLDHFKTVNDSLGHSSGDKLLVEIAKRVVDALSPEDTLARLGGDEFAVLVEGCPGPLHARRVAERIQAKFKAPHRFDGHEVFVSTSVGIAMISPRYERPEECMRDADTAMHRAKANGRGGHAIFDRQMHRRVVEQLQLENDLRRAVERREFQVRYQPIVSLDSGAVEGFEALVRWEHPERGLLMPDRFIPAAEESGLIVPIGWLVFEEACRLELESEIGRLAATPVQHLFDTRHQVLTARDVDAHERGLARLLLPGHHLRAPSPVSTRW